MIIDIHVHPFLHEKEILDEMKKASVDYAILLGVDTDPLDIEKPEIKKKLRERHLESVLGSHGPRFTSIEDEINRFFQGLISYYPQLRSSNQEIADLVRENSDRFIGFGSVNPNKDSEYVEAKLDEISSLGLKGIKMLPTLQFFSPIENRNFEKICEYCERNNKVLLYHTGCDPGPWEVPELSQDANPKHLKPVLERYSPIIVLAHAGSYSAYKQGIWFDEALTLGKEFENVYFDSSAASSFIYSERILNKIRDTIGLDRLFYGSDFPVVWGSDMEYEVNVIRKCKHLTDDEKTSILGLNAARVLNLGSGHASVN